MWLNRKTVMHHFWYLELQRDGRIEENSLDTSASVGVLPINN